ncbi:hypothetical protein [Nocardioides sp.]|uniref:hypothetical protein n=1 Tax=Nocardioides sp. TaxID=35761 RepID=UPI002CC85144|nr:hypothetical protein [Nocardioides sp.]HSX66359.1 hypothetical protein [Nocardioides sp.]
MTATDRLRRAARRALDARWSGIHADHVGLIDATTLWFSASALPRGARLALRGPAGTIDLGVAATAGGLSATIDLTPYADRAGGPDGLELVVLTRGRARLVRPAAMTAPEERPCLAPPMPGTHHAWRLHIRPSVRLQATSVTEGVGVRSLAVVDDELEVLLDLPGTSAVSARAVVAEDAAVPLPVEKTDAGWVLRLGDEHVGGDLEVRHRLRVEVDGRDLPVVRAWRELRDPGRGVPLPRLSGAGEQGDTLIWVDYDRAGVLSARRRELAEALS